MGFANDYTHTRRLAKQVKMIVCFVFVLNVCLMIFKHQTLSPAAERRSRWKWVIFWQMKSFVFLLLFVCFLCDSVCKMIAIDTNSVFFSRSTFREKKKWNEMGMGMDFLVHEKTATTNTNHNSIDNYLTNEIQFSLGINFCAHSPNNTHRNLKNAFFYDVGPPFWFISFYYAPTWYAKTKILFEE